MSVACPAWMSVPRGPPLGLPQTLLEALSPARASAATASAGPLRPRHTAVPSDRPLPKQGGPCPVRPCEPGAGEGPPTGTVDADRRRAKSPRGPPSPGQGCGRKGLGTPGRGETPLQRACSGRDAGASPLGPVRPQAHPLCSLAPGKTGALAKTVSRVRRAETARARGCARRVSAGPWPGGLAKRARGGGPAGCGRRHNPGAAAPAPWRGAGPLCWPAVPSRWPAAALAHVPRRQDETPAGTRAQRSLAGMASRRPRLRRGPRPGPVWHRARGGAAWGGAVGKRARASAWRRAASEVRSARATARVWGTAGASKRAATPARWVGEAIGVPRAGRWSGRFVCWTWARKVHW